VWRTSDTPNGRSESGVAAVSFLKALRLTLDLLPSERDTLYPYWDATQASQDVDAFTERHAPESPGGARSGGRCQPRRKSAGQTDKPARAVRRRGILGHRSRTAVTSGARDYSPFIDQTPPAGRNAGGTRRWSVIGSSCPLLVVARSAAPSTSAQEKQSRTSDGSGLLRFANKKVNLPSKPKFCGTSATYIYSGSAARPVRNS
jgi:hypothetical protein